jgi:hypothetical protein
MGKNSGPKATSTLTPEQKSITKELSNYLLGRGPKYAGQPSFMQRGATAYDGQLTAPFMRNLGGMQRSSLISAMSGRPSYNLDPKTTQRRFQQSVVTPALHTYETQIKPRIQEAYAGTGAAFHSRSGDQQVRTLSDMQVGFDSELSNMLFQNQNLAAQLAESASQRQLAGVGMAEQMATTNYNANNAALQAQYGEAMRMAPENNPWLQTALAATGQQNMALYNKQSGAGAIGGGALGGLMLGMSAAVPGIGPLPGLLLGAGMGAFGSM